MPKRMGRAAKAKAAANVTATAFDEISSVEGAARGPGRRTRAAVREDAAADVITDRIGKMEDNMAQYSANMSQVLETLERLSTRDDRGPERRSATARRESIYEERGPTRYGRPEDEARPSTSAQTAAAWGRGRESPAYRPVPEECEVRAPKGSALGAWGRSRAPAVTPRRPEYVDTAVYQPGVDAGDELDREMDRQRALYRRTEGRQMVLSDLFIQNPIAKPHLYLKRAGCASVAMKLAARETMSPLEYVAAFTRMMRDARCVDAITLPHLMEHLYQLTQDLLTHPWEDLREWSQALFDDIERGEISWEDEQEIQHRRTRARAPGRDRGRPVNGSGFETGGGAAVRTCLQAGPHERPCPGFNEGGSQQCGMGLHHSDGVKDLIHACAYCFRTVQEFYDHPEFTCRRKLGHLPTKN